ncbi:hypothetical protein LCGC14_0624050 [marine sediment metagenome]|uniref:Uncharacterized protein n=1 Tax=marine sediment metagenome TaxID=412755 RepID=A0A0F9RND1_9ZZZZ
MPVYNFMCPRCGEEDDDLCAYRDKKYPKCKCGRKMVDDYCPRTTKTYGDKERVSTALGVHPSQIASGEAERVHPGARFNENGDMLIKNRAEQKQRLRERNWVDRNSYC